jgi:peptide deformylase
MAVQTILRMGHPTLRLLASPLLLSEIGTPEFQELIQDMQDTMDAAEGIGIAAPQIGVSQQVAIIGIEKENPRYPEAEEFELITVINPKITILDKTLQGHWEGCLSVPDLRGYVERPIKVQIDYIDPQKQAQSFIAEGFPATIFQHEIDHLLGKLYVDHIKDKELLSFTDEFYEYHAPDAQD